MGELSFEHHFTAPRSAVWRALGDTEHLNRAAGLPPVTYRDEPQVDGTTRRFATTHKLGLDVEYEELPFRWIFERELSVVRLYSKGPFAKLVWSVTLRPAEHGCVAVTRFEWTPKPGLEGLVAGASMRHLGLKPMMKAYAELDRRLTAEPPVVALTDALPPTLFEAPAGASDDEVRRIRAAMPAVHATWSSPLVAKLEAALVETSSEELRRMRPRAWARRWSAGVKDTLDVFLAATKAGVLRMRWDVICPHCRGDKQNLSSLGDVRDHAFCSACNIDFDVDLDRSLEPVFAPHPRVREIDEARYCLGGPGTTPHVVAQTFLTPGQQDRFALELPAGRYRVRFTGAKDYRWIDVREGAGGEGRAAFTVRDDGVDGPDLALSPGTGVELTIDDRARRPVLVAIESITWARDVMSAAELVADQRFRDLFSGEVLAPGVKLAIERATILFTDLVGSTAMYQALGDASAFSLVWTHFDVLREVVGAHRGAIVKTIGDAIMAVFLRPEDALDAAAELHARVGSFCRERGHVYPVSLKIGMHDGPCIAVTLNDRLDYFGSTVNLAARVEAQSQGDDIVVSEALATRTSGAEQLTARGWIAERLSARCKGFTDPIPMLRFHRWTA
ncbi:DUF5939 domain-containing protein [Myxococcota bacterium]|nr:DUF5939 domain-containing protein [Myxococcota bacterium]